MKTAWDEGSFFLQKHLCQSEFLHFYKEYKSETAIYVIVRELLPPADWNPVHSVRMWKKNLFSKLSKVMIFLQQCFTLFMYNTLLLQNI